MKRRVLLLLALAGFGMLLTTGCKSDPGSKEYIPGKGWKTV
jgi:hypothetical protein